MVTLQGSTITTIFPRQIRKWGWNSLPKQDGVWGAEDTAEPVSKQRATALCRGTPGEPGFQWVILAEEEEERQRWANVFPRSPPCYIYPAISQGDFCVHIIMCTQNHRGKTCPSSLTPVWEKDLPSSKKQNNLRSPWINSSNWNNLIPPCLF